MFKFAMIGFVAAGVVLAQEDGADKRLQNATAVVNEMMTMPDKGIPRDTIDKAQCVVVIPGMKKAALGIGGQFGRGFASCKKGGAWGAPAAVKLEGGSIGFQLGGQSTDVIMLVMNQRGMDRLTSDKFTLGADAAVAAGPVGRDARADTDVMMHAEILSWSRSRGAFAGVSLQGATLRPDKEENQKLYGKAVNNKEILDGGVPTPQSARILTSALNRSGEQADRPVKK